MKVSRLIELLQEFQRLYGDLPVYLKGRGVPCEAVKTCDPYPKDETGPLFMGGVCLIDRIPPRPDPTKPLNPTRAR